jgi:hypothetical protein
VIKINIQGYPLYWPEGWVRTKMPQRARFDTSMANARDGLLNSIRMMGGKQIVLSTNIPLRQDGLPYARYTNSKDTGVAVYFQLNKTPQVFACDKWDKIEDNMQAIRKTIEAIRGIERWGSSEMMNRIYRGFQALPHVSSATNESWWNILGVDPNASIDEIEKAYKRKAKEAHPDMGGSNEAFIKHTNALEQARKLA